MKKTFLVAFAMSVNSTVVLAETLSAEVINAAPIVSIVSDRPAQLPEQPDPSIIRLQVLLDRTGASPGVIDGRYGENVSKGISIRSNEWSSSGWQTG